MKLKDACARLPMKCWNAVAMRVIKDYSEYDVKDYGVFSFDLLANNMLPMLLHLGVNPSNPFHIQQSWQHVNHCLQLL